MKIKDIEDPITFFRRQDLERQLWKMLPKELLEALEIEAVPTRNKSRLISIRVAFVVLECFLQFIGEEIVPKKSRQTKNQDLIRLAVGAIYSDHFCNLDMKSRYLYAFHILKYVSCIPYIGPMDVHISTLGPTVQVAEFVRRCSDLIVDKSVVRVWYGWPVKAGNGDTIYIPLASVFLTFGWEFTQTLFGAVEEFYSGRRHTRRHCIPALCELLVDEVSPKELFRLQDPVYVSYFFQKLLIRYLQQGYRDGKGARYSTLATVWRGSFVYFAKHYLFRPGLFAEPLYGMPMPLKGAVPGAKANVVKRGDGVIVKRKLLTDVPLHVSDSDAIKVLFSQVETDLKIVRAWADKRSNDTWRYYCHRIENALKGCPVALPHKTPHSKDQAKVWLVSEHNPDRAKNAAATFESVGFLTDKDTHLQKLYGQGRPTVAKKLGLPVIGSLLPFCVLLVLDHPIITLSFLENFMLFNDEGVCVGLRETDAGRYLVGYKPRSGPGNAEQAVLLNNKTSVVVDRIIAITGPLREYLRSRGDPKWRYLLLSSGKGFGYPKRWLQKREVSQLTGKETLISQIMNTGAGQEDATRLASRLSVVAVRASAAVKVYLETHSVQEMALALGHKEYDPDLMSRYLPAAICEFFQERWIRVFQTGIILQAMEESCHRLEASGFDSMEKLNEFLSNNFMPINVEKRSNATSQTGPGKVLFNVNEQILSLMVRLLSESRSAPGNIGALTRYWSAIAAHLIDFIESEACHSQDIKNMLVRAKEAPADQRFGSLVYE